MNMTWREYLLRREGYLREKNNENTRHTKYARMISYWTLVSTGVVDTRKMSIEKFMPLDEKVERARIEDWQKEALMKAVNEAVNDK